VQQASFDRDCCAALAMTNHADPATPASPLGLLAARRFGPLFATQFLSAFNDNALKNALVLIIAYRADQAGAAPLLIPLAGGLFILPFFLCSACAGELADASDKARLVRLIKLIEIAVMIVAAVGIVLGNVGLLLALLFAMGVEAAFFGPIKYAILPDLLAPEELLLGNALVEAGTFLAILLGTIAGVLVALGDGGATVAGLIVLVAVAAWGASFGIPATEPAAARRRFDWNLLAGTARLLREAAAMPVPFRAMLAISWFWLVGATFLAQFPSYVHFVLGAEEAVVTLFLTVFSVGIAVGSLVCNRILCGRVSARTVPWGALGIGAFSIDLWVATPAVVPGSALAGLAAFVAAPAHWRILADLFGMAVAGGIFIVPLYALLQVASETGHRARAIAANNVVNAAAMVVSALATMALIAAGVSVAGLFLLCGVATLGVAALLWRDIQGGSRPRAQSPSGNRTRRELLGRWSRGRADR
jgi:acyl-[acyl-carrier-protein]-phospholipid O-acyltransferase/long-chain-fatty-acid--[acyl-carrier-protein] ligase